MMCLGVNEIGVEEARCVLPFDHEGLCYWPLLAAFRHITYCEEAGK
jgi:hypothetical protein